MHFTGPIFYVRQKKHAFVMFFFIFFYRNLLNIRNTLYLYEIFYKNILLTLKLFVMNKAELIDAIAAEAKLTKADSKKALDAFIKATTQSLKKGGRVALVGFGSFAVAKRSARTGRNPQTGKPINIKAKNVVKFKAGADLLKTVQ